MKIRVVHPKNLQPVDVAVIGVFTEKAEDHTHPQSFQAFIASGRKLNPKIGKKFEQLLIPTSDASVRKAVLVIGLGEKKSFGVMLARQAAAAAIREIRPLEPARVVIAYPNPEETTIHAIVDGVEMGVYEHTYQTKEKEKKEISTLHILAQNPLSTVESEAVGSAVSLTRRLVDEPSNKMTPTVLAHAAETVARRRGMSLKVIGEKEARALGMGAFAAVAQGSDEEGKVIVVTYRGRRRGGPTIGLVGKGITFDSGGLSLKPGKGMEMMKLDMAGGATVLGVLDAVGALAPKVNVIGIIMAAENSPSGKASRPGDVVTSFSGKTVEILNTDAEGRLVVADGVTYAEKLGATHIIDIATLTGACMVALGQEIVGVMGKPQSFVEKIKHMAQATGERIWELPLDDDFGELLKSSIADLKNVGGSYGGAITGGKFIELATGVTKPWAHLDIAGPAFEEKGKPWMGRGGTGVMVRTLALLIRRMER